MQCSNFIDCLCDILQKNKAGLKDQDIHALKKGFHEAPGANFEEFLLEENLVSKEDLLNALAEYYATPAIDVPGIFFEHLLLRMFPKDLMLRHGFIPYQHDGDVLIVIAAYPNNEELPDIIGQFVSYDIVFMVSIYRDISDAVEEYFDEPLTDVRDRELSLDEEKREDDIVEDMLDGNPRHD